MAKYTGTYKVTSLTASADGALTNSGYCSFLQCGTATQQIKISEVYIGGEAPSASAVAIMVLARDGTALASGAVTGVTQTLTDVVATAPATLPVSGNSSTTVATRTSSHLLHLSFNAYGGIVRWVASPDQTISLYGTAVTTGEVSLSAFTGTTASTPVSGHMLYEVV